MQTLIDSNGIPYTEERIENFLEIPEDQIEELIHPEILLTIRKYPKRYLIAFEVDECLGLPYDPVDGDDANRCYIPPRVYLWSERYLHSDFESRREQILAQIKAKLRKHYLSP